VEVKGLERSFGLSILPSVTVLAGRLVVVREGSYHVLRSNGGEISFDTLISAISKEYENLHLVDLDSVTKGKTQLSILRNAADELDVWYDGGFMNSEEIYDPIMVGAAGLVLGTKSLESLEPVLDCFELTPNVIFELDHHDGIISPSDELAGMDVTKLLRKVRSIGISEIIVADFKRMEEGGDLDFALLKKAVSAGFSVYAAGDVTPTDLAVLREIGAKGAVMKLESILR